MLKCIHLWKTRLVDVNQHFIAHMLLWHPVMFSSLNSRFKQALMKAQSLSSLKGSTEQPGPSPSVVAVRGHGWAGSSRQVPARHQAALASKQGSAYTQTSGHFFPSHYLDTTLSVCTVVWGRKPFFPIIPKIQGSLQLAKWSSLSDGFSFQFLCKLCCTYNDIKVK